MSGWLSLALLFSLRLFNNKATNDFTFYTRSTNLGEEYHCSVDNPVRLFTAEELCSNHNQQFQVSFFLFNFRLPQATLVERAFESDSG